jgi:hypothetical protein
MTGMRSTCLLGYDGYALDGYALDPFLDTVVARGIQSDLEAAQVLHKLWPHLLAGMP